MFRASLESWAHSHPLVFSQHFTRDAFSSVQAHCHKTTTCHMADLEKRSGSLQSSFLDGCGNSFLIISYLRRKATKPQVHLSFPLLRRQGFLHFLGPIQRRAKTAVPPTLTLERAREDAEDRQAGRQACASHSASLSNAPWLKGYFLITKGNKIISNSYYPIIID